MEYRYSELKESMENYTSGFHCIYSDSLASQLFN